MPGRYFVKLILAISLTMCLMLSIYSGSTAEVRDQLFSEVKGKMAAISQKEKDTLQKLFTQSQVIDATGKKVAETAGEIKKAENVIEGLKKAVSADEAACTKERENLKKVLQYYQKMGPGSYLEMIFESDSLSDLLDRINILRDLARDTKKLMDRITEDKEKQAREEEKLSLELASVQKRQQELEQTLAEEQKLKGDMEAYLASLKEERGHYQQELDSLQKAWDGLKPFIAGTSQKLSDFLATASLPTDAMRLSVSLTGARVSIDDKVIDELLAAHKELGSIIFSFHQGKVEIGFPDENFTLSGKFAVVDGHSLKFEAEEGSVYGMALDKNAVTELLKDENLELDLEGQLYGLTLKTVDIMDGYMRLNLGI